MIDPCFFIGAPREFQNKCLVYPPTLKQVLSDSNFNALCAILTISQEDLNDELELEMKPGEKVPTPLEYLLSNCFHNADFRELTKKAFLLFTRQQITILYEKKWIIFGDLEQMIGRKEITSIDQLLYLSEENYFQFQNLIREACGLKPIKPYIDDPNEDPRVKRIKAKARYRDRLKQKKGSSNSISLTTSIIAVCCMGIGVTPMTIGEMSYAAIHALMSTYQEKEKYDIDIRSILAGADPKKIQPKYWIKNSID